MRRVFIVLGLLVCASQAMALNFTENFNSYDGGSTLWGANSHWVNSGFKLDLYTKDASLGPRCGTTGTKTANLDLVTNGNLAAGQVATPAMDLSSSFHWSNAAEKVDTFIVILSDDSTTAALVPRDTTSLATPINAIAWGHNANNANNYSFFNGQSWTVVGPLYDPYDANGGRGDFVQGSIDAAGNWSVRSYNPVTGPSGAFVTGTLAMSNFNFDTVSMVSKANTGTSGYAGMDDIVVNAVTTPEPATLALLSLGTLLLRRRRA